MYPFVRFVGVVGVFFTATVAWLVLGGVTSSRTSDQRGALEGNVADLWGNPQTQLAPAFELRWIEPVHKTEEITDPAGKVTTKTTIENVSRTQTVDPARSRVEADLHLDQRRKGLLWFPLYDVGLFFLFVSVVTLLRKIEIHPVNFLFVAAAFFSFNLLFGYIADRLPIETAFVIASIVSVGLVTSYLRLVAGARFALVEAGLAQLLYQVGFSVAHFFEGYTGLSITLLVIVTLFLLMQLTGRVSWTRAFASPTAHPA